MVHGRKEYKVPNVSRGGVAIFQRQQLHINEEREFRRPVIGR